MRLERLRQLKKSNDLIGNRTRNLPVCITVPQPSMLPRAPITTVISPLLTFHDNMTNVLNTLASIVSIYIFHIMTPFKISTMCFTCFAKRMLLLSEKWMRLSHIFIHITFQRSYCYTIEMSSRCSFLRTYSSFQSIAYIQILSAKSCGWIYNFVMGSSFIHVL
jgi:hypothetical protein